MLFKLILLLAYSNHVIKADWVAPFFRDSGNLDVTLEPGTTTTISMNEELEVPFVVAIVAGYSGTQKPSINFQDGNNFDLGLDFELNENSEWEMIVKNKQDYEQERMRSYYLYIEIDSVRIYVAIEIKNIFDNIPVITADTNPCVIEELLDANFETECYFNVFDIDGMADNRIEFNIDGSFNEENLFFFQEVRQSDVNTIIYRLVVLETLYYDQRALYNFRVYVRDIGGNQGSINVFIDVKDMPNKEPMWMKAFASARFPEKKDQTFEVLAIDGDTGINTEICYKLEFEAEKDYSDFISIDGQTGQIDVKEINRDEKKNEFYPFKVIAFKCNDDTSFIIGSAALIVDDINDNLPEIYLTKTTITLKEETFDTLFDSSELFAEDLDLGSHATYEIILTQSETSQANYANAFNIIPINGYQRQTFTISVADTSLIDFEDPLWRNFDITIKATETDFRDRETSKVFSVVLLNWNDELPEFELEEYIFRVEETVAEDFFIGAVKANDKDIGEEIHYFINGRIGESIAIDLISGELKTISDGVFDYETQTEVIFQVQARDTLQTMGEPTHSTFTQIRIEVIDVNDEAPQLKLPREILSIRENVRDEMITDKIEAFDPDTTAKLKFTIDWEESYATKPGFQVDRDFYEGCFIIEELEETNNKVFGILRANPDFKHNIDYEKFEIVYLSIVVEDTDQEIMPNFDDGILVVRILDENDNPPEFVDDTLTVSRRVLEEAEENTLIGTIIAQDIDGPGNNIIKYTISPLGETPVGWVTIDETTGAIKVLADREIGCDVPRRDDLIYQVTLDDGANKTLGQISIDITDINNKSPEEGSFESTIYLFENAKTGEFITKIIATDLDRDAPHNVIQYYINFALHPLLQRFFVVDSSTGELTVNLFAGNELDRDNGEDKHLIWVNFQDNFNGFGASYGGETLITLILKDVNDNAPEMPIKDDYEISENAGENYIIDNQFYAPDKDEPDTPNSKVLYEILSIEPVDVNSEDPSDYENLFAIESYDDKYGRILTSKAVKGFSGKWSIEIRAYDRGDEGESQISLSSIKSYIVNINPFNFNAPKIVYPSNDETIRLDYGSIEVGKGLTLFNGNILNSFEAVDDDADIFGDITFEITSGNEDHTFFEMFKLNRKQSEMRVTSGAIDERTYTLTISAIDGGGRSDNVNIRMSFVNTTGEPYFVSPRTWTTDFTENIEGREEFRFIPEAIDPKNIGVINDEDLLPIYYFIDESFRPEDSQFFQLDSVTRQLSLSQDLDRENVDHHQIRIISTNLAFYPAIRPSENSLLTIDITVNDVNDNPPTFQNKKYAVGISEKDNRLKTLLTIFAIDPDLDDEISYYLLTETIKANGDNLENVKDTAFTVERQSGNLILNFDVQANMKGFFEFQVQARDLVDHTDEASVKIYLVADANRVTFVFENEIEFVKNVDREVLALIFSNSYDAECVIDEIIATSIEGVAQSTMSDLRVHFVKDDEAIEASEVLQQSTDLVFITKLNAELVRLGLNLQGLPTPEVQAQEPSRNIVIEVILAILSAVLAVLLAGLAMLYFLKGRSYQRQIDVLTASVFGSNSSELNSNIKPLPNTNIFSNERSNPVMNNSMSKVDLDTKSIISSDSDDFAGLGDNPIFNVDTERETSKNPFGQKFENSNDSSSYI